LALILYILFRNNVEGIIGRGFRLIFNDIVSALVNGLIHGKVAIAVS
jgi:hypothetical protein